MSKRITVAQLKRAINKSPQYVESEGNKFLQRGLSEYKRVAVQSAPWRVGQKGGGIPKRKGRYGGNLREQHRTKIKGLEGRFGVSADRVPYAPYVYYGTRKMKARPWLDYAQQRCSKSVEKHYKTFLDNLLNFIAQ